MSSKAAQMLGHPPGLDFRPGDDELIEFFLLPRVRGEPAWFPSVVVIDDDTAANTHPSNLLERHGLAGDRSAYFFVHTSNAAARQDRSCAGGGTWVSQKPVSGGACIGGEMIRWRRLNLNLQTDRGKIGGGSVGWVMHEYTLTEPPCPFLKLCHVTFSGHGRDSKRAPDGEAGSCQADEPAPKRASVAATTSTWSIPFAASAGGADVYVEQQMALTEQHQPISQQLQPAQSYPTACASGSTTTVADQQGSSVAAAHGYAGQEPAQDIDEEALEWFSLHSDELLANAEPTAEHSMVPQLMTSGEDQGISPASNQQLLDGTCLPADERLHNTSTDQVIQDVQVQPEETSCWDWNCFPSAADLLLDSSTAEPQQGLDEQEQLFWKSIGVDTDNIAFFPKPFCSVV